MSFAQFALFIEIVIVIGILFAVPYTEIDWRAYMEEVGGFLRGQLDYAKLQGGTGPLVYPGGFVWIHSALFYLTKGGADVELAQWIHAGVFWGVVALALSFYYRCGLKRPGRTFVSLLFSKRIHSLFVLRMFNDCWAVLIAYLAISYLADRRARLRWFLGCTLFSIAVSVKMNILLFAPGLLYVMLRSLPLYRVVFFLGVCAASQLIAGYPFLMHNWPNYVARAFELGRIFTQRWSVNFQFLPEEVFADPVLGHALLAATAASWVLLWALRWRRRTYIVPAAKSNDTAKKKSKHGGSGGGGTEAKDAAHADDHHDATEEEEAGDELVYRSVALTLLESNLVAVALARSLHYQFYCWFFYSVPLVLYHTKLPAMLALGSFGLVRQGFENYPPTEHSSLMVVGGFAVMVLSVIFLGCDEGRDVRTAAAKAVEDAKKAAAKAEKEKEKKTDEGESAAEGQQKKAQ